MAENKMAPVLFEPLYKEKIWGGNNLNKILNKNINILEKTGESWEISGHQSSPSIAVTKPYKGMTLIDIMCEYGRDILGKDAEHADFPLLCKFIDANDKLSIQVHPDDRQALDAGWGKKGKTECWYIVEAKPGAKIIAGLKKDITPDRIKDYIAQNKFEECLNYIEIKKGDVLFIPAGTVHAIMDGTVIYEIQESSDITYRLYDWDRVDINGKQRRLHIDESVQIISPCETLEYKIPPLKMLLAKNENNLTAAAGSVRSVSKYFALEEYDFYHTAKINLPVKKSFRILTVISGLIELHYYTGTMIVCKGQTVLIPASIKNVQTTGLSHTKFLVTTIPDIMDEIIRPLKNKGFKDEQIIALGGADASKNDIAALLLPGELLT